MTNTTRRDRSALNRQALAPTDLLNVEEAAQRLGTPTRFIRRLIAERRIRFYKIGRYVRLDQRDLDGFISAGRIEPSVTSAAVPSAGWRAH